MNDDKSPEAPEREPWSAKDWRMLLVTILGGLAANLGTVLLVGLSLAYLHWRHSTGVSSSTLLGAGLILFVIGAAGFISVIFIIRRPEAKRVAKEDRFLRWFLWSFTAMLVAFMLTFLLVLVGVAAGIK
jgi:hypothetical protein